MTTAGSVRNTAVLSAVLVAIKSRRPI